MSLTERAIEYLNSCFEADPTAMQVLLINRVQVNKELRDHPHVVCEPLGGIVGGLVGDDPVCTLAPLGLLNGLLSRLGEPLVASKWSDPDQDGRCKLLGFQAYPLSPVHRAEVDEAERAFDPTALDAELRDVAELIKCGRLLFDSRPVQALKLEFGMLTVVFADGTRGHFERDEIMIQHRLRVLPLPEPAADDLPSGGL